MGRLLALFIVTACNLLRSPTLRVLLMKTGDRAGVVQGVTFLLKASSTRGKQTGLCFFVDSWCCVEEGPRKVSFYFFPSDLFFFFFLWDFGASLYTPVAIVGPEFSDIAEVIYGPLNFVVELYYKVSD